MKGFTIVEVIVGSAIILVFVSALSVAMSLYVSILPERINNIQAEFLAKEGVEAVKYLRNESWDNNIATLSNDTDYYLDFSGGTWSLSTTANTIDGTFTRTIVFLDVYRDGNNDIASSGTLDPDARRLLVTVSWNSESETIETYITDILGN